MDIALRERVLHEVVWLGDPACHDPARVGGKAAHLSRLAADYPVPPGFCLIAVGASARDDPALPLELQEGLAAAYDRLAERAGLPAPRVAVRSSARDEDGQTASFAGQHETELNLVGVAATTAAVVRCWASAASERVRAYRERSGLVADGAPPTVLVQQLVVADIAAVVFSANPITGMRDEVVITASWGLGESLVGGSVTPDTYRTRKWDGAPIECRIGDKRRMTVLSAQGTREVGVPPALQRAQVLDAKQLKELATLAVELERAMGWPVDLECAYQAGRLALLQCRPITALG